MKLFVLPMLALVLGVFALVAGLREDDGGFAEVWRVELAPRAADDPRAWWNGDAECAALDVGVPLELRGCYPESEDGSMVAVSLRATNVSAAPRRVYDLWEALLLEDRDGRRYGYSSRMTVTATTVMDGRLDVPLDWNPGLTYHVVVAFEVPRGTEPAALVGGDGDLRLELAAAATPGASPSPV